MFGLIIACILFIPAGIAYFKDRINELCWWSLFILINLNIGLFAIVMERLNKVTELITSVVN